MDTSTTGGRARASGAVHAYAHLRESKHRRRISLFDLSRLMGTSVEQLDKVYGHLLADSLERARTALDTYVGQQFTRPVLEFGKI